MQHHRLALRMNPVMRARSSTCTWWRLRSGEKRILGYAEQPCYLWFVLQLCKFLNQYITSWRFDPANQQKFHTIAQEHHCLPAQNHIRHRDLKPDSIPITGTITLKVADFRSVVYAGRPTAFPLSKQRGQSKQQQCKCECMVAVLSLWLRLLNSP